MVKNLLANAGDIRDLGSIPGLERYPGIFTILILPIHEHGIFLHLLVSFLISSIFLDHSGIKLEVT